MSLLSLAAMLLVLGLVFLTAEVLLPLHGSSAVGGLAAVVAAVGLCFTQSFYAGMGALTAVVLLTPAVAFWAVRIWPLTPVGRRVVLPPVTSARRTPPAYIGMTGVTVSDLKPMGVCEFRGVRASARSEYGLIAPGCRVRVVGLENNRPTVRAEGA